MSLIAQGAETVRAPGASVRSAGSRFTQGAALLGFFVITLDALIVSVALPAIGQDLGGGIAGLQWVVDGYTLMLAALLLSAGAISDRVGAKRAFGLGMAVFLAASAACGFAPGLGVLVVARFVQGAGAAVMMPATLALIRETYPDAGARTRALAIWAVGGSVGSAAGPVVGGVLAGWDWVPFGGTLAVPAMTGLMLASVPAERAGLASGVLNTFRQFGGAVAVAVYGALVTGSSFAHGMRVGLIAAAALLAVTAATGLRRTRQN